MSSVYPPPVKRPQEINNPSGKKHTQGSLNTRKVLSESFSDLLKDALLKLPN